MHVRPSALRENLARIASSVGPEARLVPMVKADAYGLGVEAAVDVLEAAGVWGLGVATVEEGVALRASGVTRPVIVFSPAPASSLADAVAADLTLTASMAQAFEDLAEAAAGAGGGVDVHVEVDTGMGRAGFDWRAPEAWSDAAREAAGRGVRWTGCFTHLHSADGDADSVHTQWGRFQEALSGMERAAGVGEGDFLVHALNSAGALRCPEYAADAVRPGIFLYGGGVGADLPAPTPVAAVRARVVHVKEARPGDTLGYGATHRAKGPERWATVAIGYGDGLPRILGNRGHALVRGRKVRIIGRISMDVTVVDISDVPAAEPGDVVTFIGADGEEEITVDDVAELAGTISYEILTGFTPRLPRIWSDRDGP